MAFIRAQFVKKNSAGAIVSGSASLTRSKRVKKPDGKSISAHVVIERLGKVLWLSDDGKTGVFLSPTRGLVECRCPEGKFTRVNADDPRLAGTPMAVPEPERHVAFGDAWLLFSFLRKSGMLAAVRNAFPEDGDYERVLCHLCCSVLTGKGSCCDAFMSGSFCSMALPDVPLPSLRCDSAYFEAAGAFSAKQAFFKAVAEIMKTREPDFGSACYVDSTPLPEESLNELAAMCSHGTGEPKKQIRLALVLDEASGVPVWFELLAGNKPDVTTIGDITEEVKEAVGIEIRSAVLDAGYVSAKLLEAYGTGSGKTFIARMPDRKGYPYRELCDKWKRQLHSASHCFDLRGHWYFGRKVRREVQGVKVTLYAYVDHDRALSKAEEQRLKHPDEYEKLSPAEKDWFNVQYGWFVLITDVNAEPKDLLEQYLARESIEESFRISKQDAGMLPLCKWSTRAVAGKLLTDVMAAMADGAMNREAKKGHSLRDLFLWARSVSCILKGDGTVSVETPTKQAVKAMENYGMTVPEFVNLAEFRRSILEAKP
jgi:hypothetical protein